MLIPAKGIPMAPESQASASKSLVCVQPKQRDPSSTLLSYSDIRRTMCTPKYILERRECLRPCHLDSGGID